MNIYVGLCVFLLGAFVLFSCCHMFVLWTFLNIVDTSAKSSYVSWSWWSAGGIALGLVVVRFVPCLATRMLYYLITLWWGLAIYIIVWSIVYHILSWVITIPPALALALILAPSIAICVYGLINAQSICVEYINIHIEGVETNLRIAHISDLHLGPIYQDWFVAKVVTELRKLAPDIVAITGDLFDGSTKLSSSMVEPFNQLSANIYFVLGNHDAIVSGLDEVMDALSNTRIILLRNEQVSYKGVNIIGFDYSTERGHLLRHLSSNSYYKDRLNVLLYHVPSVRADELEPHNIQLMLAGHTHGGQLLPFHLQAWLLFAYLTGLHVSSHGSSYVHVSAGLGTAGPPMRVLSHSTITLITINSDRELLAR